MHIELTISQFSYIPRIVERIKELNTITHISLTDKNGLPNNIIIAEMLREELPDISYTTHYALKNHTNKNPEIIPQNLIEYLELAQEKSFHDILLVSGNPQPKFDTLQAARFLTEQTDFDISNFTFSCAFNPFLVDSQGEKEWERFEFKMATQLFSRVYFQIGDHVPTLKAHVDKIQKAYPQLPITPSLLIPTRDLLKKFQFRPWKGVVLGEDYLESIQIAKHRSQKLLEYFNESELQPLIELVNLKDDTMEIFHEILK
jgi:hypothetical protein